MRLLCLAGLAAVAAMAQNTPPAATADGPVIVVRGRVLDPESKRPVRGARVTLTEQRREIASVFSDFNGRWEIAEAPVGEWGIDAAKSGYQNRVRLIVVPAAGPLSGIDLEISRLGVIAGRVTDADGRPVVAATVRVLAEESLEEQITFRQQSIGFMGGGTTDDRGLYRAYGLAPGRYAIAVAPAARPGADGELLLQQSLTFSPGVQRVEDAARVVVGRGTVTEGVDVVLASTEPTRVEGRVADAAGEACKTCSIQILAAAGGAHLSVGHVRPRQDGTFSVHGLPAGDYVLKAQGFDAATRDMLYALAPFAAVRDQPVAVRAEVSSGYPVTVNVVLEDPPEELAGDGAEPWMVGVGFRPPETERELSPMSRGMFAQTSPTNGREASVELKSYQGKYQLQVNGLQGAYIASLEADGKVFPAEDLEVPAGGLPRELTMRLRFAIGTLEGTVIDPPELVTVGLKGPPLGLILEPAGPSRGNRQRHYGQVQPDGSFSQQVAPGVYDAVVIETGQGGMAFRDPARSTALKDYRKRVEIKAGQTTTVRLAVAPVM